mmetsp:Transcript_160419/g.514876  ORF Transcript_160419/g.514876 Transcript_160419/m.514876 type:complete len:150 (-) Transcript_160419:7-456(-)
MFLVGAVLSEVVLKPLLNQPRPPATACCDESGEPTSGMPSGHAMQWQMQVTWLALQALREFPGSRGCIEASLLMLLASPLVPWARVYNGDHYLGQVLIGSLLGFALTLLSFCFWVRSGVSDGAEASQPAVLLQSEFSGVVVDWVRGQGG